MVRVLKAAVISAKAALNIDSSDEASTTPGTQHPSLLFPFSYSHAFLPSLFGSCLIPCTYCKYPLLYKPTVKMWSFFWSSMYMDLCLFRLFIYWIGLGSSKTHSEQELYLCRRLLIHPPHIRDNLSLRLRYKSTQFPSPPHPLAFTLRALFLTSYDDM